MGSHVVETWDNKKRILFTKQESSITVHLRNWLHAFCLKFTYCVKLSASFLPAHFSCDLGLWKKHWKSGSQNIAYYQIPTFVNTAVAIKIATVCLQTKPFPFIMFILKKSEKQKNGHSFYPKLSASKISRLFCLSRLLCCKFRKMSLFSSEFRY